MEIMLHFCPFKVFIPYTFHININYGKLFEILSKKKGDNNVTSSGENLSYLYVNLFVNQAVKNDFAPHK